MFCVFFNFMLTMAQGNQILILQCPECKSISLLYVPLLVRHMLTTQRFIDTPYVAQIEPQIWIYDSVVHSFYYFCPVYFKSFTPFITQDTFFCHIFIKLFIVIQMPHQKEKLLHLVTYTKQLINELKDDGIQPGIEPGSLGQTCLQATIQRAWNRCVDTCTTYCCAIQCSL